MGKFNFKKSKSSFQSTVYLKTKDGRYEVFEPISGKVQSIDEKYVMASLDEGLIIHLGDGVKVDLVKYSKGEICVNPKDRSKKIFCEPDAVSLFELICGRLIVQNQLGHFDKTLILSILYFERYYPKEFDVLFTGVVGTK